MIGKTETFLITIAVLEGRHYTCTNMDSAVIIKVDNKKRCTGVRRSTDAPIYNEVGLGIALKTVLKRPVLLFFQYFVFEFSTTLESMLEKTVTVTVRLYVLFKICNEIAKF